MAAALGVAVVAAHCGLSVGGLPSLATTAAAGSSAEFASARNADIVFDVVRLGSKIGTHTLSFEQQGPNDVQVAAKTELTVTLLTLPIYRFSHASTERWIDGALHALTARTTVNGSVSTVLASTVGSELEIKRDDGSERVALPVFPTSHWNSGVIGQRRTLNTLTGRMNAIRIAKRNTEQIATERGLVAATRYTYSGDLTNVLWYDAAGRWVGMTFAGTDGVEIKFVCRQCQG